jgi:hypothetical protein
LTIVRPLWSVRPARRIVCSETSATLLSDNVANENEYELLPPRGLLQDGSGGYQVIVVALTLLTPPCWGEAALPHSKSPMKMRKSASLMTVLGSEFAFEKRSARTSLIKTNKASLFLSSRVIGADFHLIWYVLARPLSGRPSSTAIDISNHSTRRW